jgi:hypothetical protein
MDHRLEEFIKKSGLLFLLEIEFSEKTEGRFFQKQKKELKDGGKCFYVVLLPNVESPVHNHAGQNMSETHQLLFGSGKFVVYDADGKREIELERNIPHPVFSTPEHSPDHKYVAGPEGSIVLALEQY